jgi:hypothetical protein
VTSLSGSGVALTLGSWGGTLGAAPAATVPMSFAAALLSFGLDQHVYLE